MRHLHNFSIDPMLAEVVDNSLSARLTPEVKKLVGFDRIFVEDVLSRFTVFIQECWIFNSEGNSIPQRKRKCKKPRSDSGVGD
jgi:hypothetical protein